MNKVVDYRVIPLRGSTCYYMYERGEFVRILKDQKVYWYHPEAVSDASDPFIYPECVAYGVNHDYGVLFVDENISEDALAYLQMSVQANFRQEEMQPDEGDW